MAVMWVHKGNDYPRQPIGSVEFHPSLSARPPLQKAVKSPYSFQSALWLSSQFGELIFSSLGFCHLVYLSSSCLAFRQPRCFWLVSTRSSSLSNGDHQRCEQFLDGLAHPLVQSQAYRWPQSTQTGQISPTIASSFAFWPSLWDSADHSNPQYCLSEWYLRPSKARSLQMHCS